MPFKPDRFTKNFGIISLEEALKIIPEHIEENPVTLFLPATYSDATSDAMKNIIKVLSEPETNKLLNRIIIGLDQAKTKEEYLNVVKITEPLNNRIVMWNNSPEMKELFRKMRRGGLNIEEGKGRNVWSGLGLRYQLDILEKGTANSLILHDCDIRPNNYNKNIVLSLMFPLVHPKINAHFVKASYERITTDKSGREKFAGRVVRLLLVPFVESLENTYGHIPRVSEFINYIRVFGYLLSGEFGINAELADRIPIQTDWGLEIGTLGFLFRTPYKIAQVTIGKEGIYDHKHAEAHLKKPGEGLRKIVNDVTKTILRKLYSLAGEYILDDKRFESLLTYYIKYGNELIDNYFEISKARGLYYPAIEERQMLGIFKDDVISAIETFKENPGGVRPLPSWYDTDPTFRKELTDIVLSYNQEYKLKN